MPYLTTTASCAVDDVRLQWVGDPLVFTSNSYFQAVFASAANTQVLPPSLEAWERDPRLYHWFMAQTAVKNEAYTDSIPHLLAANVGRQLEASGHWANNDACSVVNWTIASEIGYREAPEGYVQHLMNHEQYEDVAEAFTRLLRYDSDRIVWRLSLARAYVAMGNTTTAEEVLAPVFNEGTEEEINAANVLLSRP